MTPVIVTWLADERSDSQIELLVPIPVTDDEINEADSQFFVVQLTLAEAVDTVTISRSSSICRILDNDSKQSV